MARRIRRRKCSGDRDLFECFCHSAAAKASGGKAPQDSPKKPAAKQADNDASDHNVRVTGFEHGGKAGGFLFLAFAGAGFLKAPMQAHLHQRLLAVQFFLEPAQRPIDRLSFFEINFRHIRESIYSATGSGRILRLLWV